MCNDDSLANSSGIQSSHESTANKIPDQGLPRSMKRAPSRSAFARFPASWYRLCDSRDIADSPFSRQACGRRLVAFRTESGQAVVMEATCSHLGADLGRGVVVGNCIQCPYHHWEYGNDGRCEKVPGTNDVPEFARQNVFPVVERHGGIYFFNGPKASFPLPFVIDESPESYRSIRPRSFSTNCAWYMAAAHAFDEKHFETVHGRRLVSPLTVDTPHPMARRCRYRAEILPDSFADRVLRVIGAPEVEISITVWGGTFTVVTGDFGPRRSRFFLVTEPIDDDDTRCDVVVFSPLYHGRIFGGLFESIAIRVRRYLTATYLHGETEALGGPKYNQTGLTEFDDQLIDFFCWIAEIGKPKP